MAYGDRSREEAPEIDWAFEAQSFYGSRGGNRDSQSRQQRPQALEEGPEGQEPSGSLRDLTHHVAVKKDLKRLDPQIARAAIGTMEEMQRGERNQSTHPLRGPLKGWEATDVRGFNTHRITHRSIPGGAIEIGHIGPHNYDQAVQRLASVLDNPREFGRHMQSEQHVYDVDNENGQGTHELCVSHIKARMSLDHEQTMIGLHTGLIPHDAPEKPDFGVSNPHKGQCRGCATQMRWNHKQLSDMTKRENPGAAGDSQRARGRSPYSNLPQSPWAPKGTDKTEPFHPTMRSMSKFDWDEKPCTACSGTGEQGTGHECYQCDGTGLACDQDTSIDNANPENGLLVGRNDAKKIKPIIARFTPDKRVFTHTCGLDHRLFDGEKLRPEVRRYILRTLGAFWLPLYGAGWDDWSLVYFAGSEASEWTSDMLEGNNDFDVLVGVDYDKFKAAHPEYAAWTTEQITTQFNAQFKNLNNPNTYITVEGTPYGPFDNTWYVNQDSYNIKDIKPYAAYNVSDSVWAVKPPHLPHWSLSDVPRAVQRVLRACDTLANDILKLPEPERTQQGAALFDSWHSDRSRAFSTNGQGWYDIANLREKWLDQEGIWQEIVNCKHRYTEGLGVALPGWSNTPMGYVAVKIDDYTHDPDRTWFHGTDAKFKEFGDQKPSVSGDWNAALGHHFSTEEPVAKQFGKNVHKVKLDMHNPKVYHSEHDMDREVVTHELGEENHYTKHVDPSLAAGLRGGPAAAWKDDKAFRNGSAQPETAPSLDVHNWLHHHPDKKAITERYKGRLLEQGHDGIVYGNEYEGKGHASAIAFDPKQISHDS